MWYLLAGFALVAVALPLAFSRSTGPHRHVPPAQLSQLASMAWREEDRR